MASSWLRMSALGIVISLVTAMTSLAAEGPKTPKRPVIGGYYAAENNDKGYRVDRIDRNYTMLLAAFWSTDPEGNILHKPDPELVKAGHKNGQTVLLSLGGGGGRKGFEGVTETPQKQKAYVRNVLNFVDKHDFDGIDVDWEHPDSPETGRRWTVLATELRTGLDAIGQRKKRKLLLTTALPPGSWSWRHIDAKVLRNCLDYINVMCYDHAWNTSSYHAPLKANPADPTHGSFVDMLKELETKAGYPRNRIIVGLPFYGNHFHTDKPFVRVPSNTWRQITYQRAVTLTKEFTCTYEPHSAGMWCWSKDRQQLVIYDCPRSIYEKTTYYLNHGYAGVFCWTLHHDELKDGTQPLTRAMMTARDEFLKRQQTERTR